MNINEIIEDALALKKYFGMTIDYVVNSKITGLLEVNDMVGLPEDSVVRDTAKDYWLKICKNHFLEWIDKNVVD